MGFRFCSFIVLIAALFSQCVYAATTTTNFQVQMVITDSCVVTSASDLDFGTHGTLGSNTDAATSFSVQCTNTLAYDIGLSVGSGSGATTAARKMTGPSSATLNYALYQNSSRTTLWGETIGTNAMHATGNGNAQTYNVYGRAPTQTTPIAGAYTDTVTITVTY